MSIKMMMVLVLQLIPLCVKHPVFMSILIINLLLAASPLIRTV